ncbi:hypothetical protein GLIP_1649 [Aliiglaciecola lipolytica E3]|uniref:DUF2919 domain-containing protein n=1 Tax=Aliiglaciecola lipolytica E3 TaxID=1127673 RepID=K6Y7V7_9ALTE|nr:hypothetical protein GLIP_1649 [Aliiglaciecola lipolytica E3]
MPLNHYDEAGRIKPPRFFWWCCLFLAKSYVIFVLSLSNFRDADGLLEIFYPRQSELYIGFGIGAGALLAITLVAYREKWWDSSWQFLRWLIKPCLVLTVLLDLFHQSQILIGQHWRFSWATAILILFDFVIFYWVLKSRHLRYMIADWADKQP